MSDSLWMLLWYANYQVVQSVRDFDKYKLAVAKIDAFYNCVDVESRRHKSIDEGSNDIVLDCKGSDWIELIKKFLNSFLKF